MQGAESPEDLLKYYCTNEVAFDDSINTQIQPSVLRGGTAGRGGKLAICQHTPRQNLREGTGGERGRAAAGGAWRVLFTTL